MYEYIVEYPDDLIAEGYAEACVNIHERITRCRDCAYFIEERGCCDYRKPFMFTVSPDGFCNNAKEKE